VIMIYERVIDSESMKSNKRQQLLFHKNKLIKLLMIDGQTVLRKRQKLAKSVYDSCLMIKMAKI
jgi:hypothetical protein